VAYTPPKPARLSGIDEFPGMVCIIMIFRIFNMNQGLPIKLSGQVSLHNGIGDVCAGSVLDELHVLTTGRCGNLL